MEQNGLHSLKPKQQTKGGRRASTPGGLFAIAFEPVDLGLRVATSGQSATQAASHEHAMPILVYLYDPTWPA